MNKNVYLCGIGGIGMANLAALLHESGYSVSGSDAGIYEPAASILRSRKIPVLTPYSAVNVPRDGRPIVMGNALSRGHVEVETILETSHDLYSFPEFLRRSILRDRHAVVVAGTHGKSSTTACIAHILEKTGLDPGYLIGALPTDSDVGARLGDRKTPFIVEGDEYDSAFFDKRSKFLHYFPRTLVLGPVEFDHADIFTSEQEMLLSFQHLLNLLPANGALIYAADSANSNQLAQLAPCPTVSVGMEDSADWRLLSESDGLSFRDPSGKTRRFEFCLLGQHNRMNALMAVATTVSLGVDLESAGATLSSFSGIRRRLEKIYENENLIVFDDFAHHPTAIKATLEAVREAYPIHKIIAVFEPRSNTMVRNIFQEALPQSFTSANHIVAGSLHRMERIPPESRLDLNRLGSDMKNLSLPFDQIENRAIPEFLSHVLADEQTIVLFMSNGAFDNIQGEFIRLISNRTAKIMS